MVVWQVPVGRVAIKIREVVDKNAYLRREQASAWINGPDRRIGCQRIIWQYLHQVAIANVLKDTPGGANGQAHAVDTGIPNGFAIIGSEIAVGLNA